MIYVTRPSMRAVCRSLTCRQNVSDFVACVRTSRTVIWQSRWTSNGLTRYRERRARCARLMEAAATWRGALPRALNDATPLPVELQRVVAAYLPLPW